ncbi:hypothetical protein NPIL_82211 [Nephila pilipes]|uniref:Uncharacterized protein n=1 Tax=Nephila pilipes TaxID=299642 RepID=A0A8X6QZ99_NEPPI|nr:hypothetical protein NPIL_82211 [Nephila pilipes]
MFNPHEQNKRSDAITMCKRRKRKKEIIMLNPWCMVEVIMPRSTKQSLLNLIRTGWKSTLTGAFGYFDQKLHRRTSARPISKAWQLRHCLCSTWCRKARVYMPTYSSYRAPSGKERKGERRKKRASFRVGSSVLSLIAPM